MNKINNLDCSGHPEQASEARNTPASPAEILEVEHLAAFARRLGVNRSTVTRAAQAGRLVLAADGRVHIAASLARWHATRGGRLDVADRHADARGHAIAAVAGVAPAATGPADANPVPMASDQGAGDTQIAPPGSRAFWEAEKVRWQNAELLLALDLDAGARIPRATLQREARGLGATLRAEVERLIDQTAPRLAAAKTSEDRRRLLTAELQATRRLMLREFSTAARRLRPDGLSPVRAATVTEAQEPTP